MKYQYLGTTGNLLSAYQGGFLLVYIIDARHGEVRDTIGPTTPLQNYVVLVNTVVLFHKNYSMI